MTGTMFEVPAFWRTINRRTFITAHESITEPCSYYLGTLARRKISELYISYEVRFKVLKFRKLTLR